MTEEMDFSHFKDVFVSEAKENLVALNTSLLELEKNCQDRDILNGIFRVAHTLKGIAATMGFDKITRLAHDMENVLDKLRKGESTATGATVEILFGCLDTLEMLVDEVATGQDRGVTIEPLLEKITSLLAAKEAAVPAPPLPPPAPVPSLPVVPPPLPSVPVPPADVAEEKPASEQKEPEAPVHAAASRTQTVRIRIEQLDKLMNLVGELVINKSRLQQIAQLHRIAELSSALTQFDRISIDLQEEVVKTRMVPVRNTFDRYPRLVRDLAKRLNKEIEFEIVGSEIEFDRNLLEQVNEPLVHLLRNACDHGIEPPETRRQAGKKVAGTVRLVSKRERGYCIIEVSDDGVGMDTEFIRRKAVERGIILEEEAALLSATETLMLICDPKFSTTKEITDISGRGVGMDVVKNLVEGVNGKLEIFSAKGKGSVFTLHLPLTLAIIQALLVNVGREVYAIPLTNVVEIASVEPAFVKTIGKKEVLMLRNEVITLFRLGRIFADARHPAAAPESGAAGEGSYAVVVEIRGKKIGLMVDGMVGQQEIVIKTLYGLFKYAKNFSGATILGNGRVVLIIDVASLT